MASMKDKVSTCSLIDRPKKRNHSLVKSFVDPEDSSEEFETFEENK